MSHRATGSRFIVVAVATGMCLLGCEPSPAAAKPPPGDVEHSAGQRDLTERSECSGHATLVQASKNLALDLEKALRRAHTYPEDKARRLGREALGHLERKLGGKLTTKGRRAQYVATLGRRLARSSKRGPDGFKFFLLEGSKAPNALAMPGGFVVVTSGMLDGWIEDEAQLAGVIAHEIGHVELRHSTAILGALAAAGIDDENMVAQMVAALLSQPYNSAREEEADRWGLGASYKAGYSSLTVARMWDAVARRSGQGPDRPGQGGLVGTMLSTAKRELDALVGSHPAAPYRACVARKTAYDLHAASPRAASYLGGSAWRRGKTATEGVLSAVRAR